MKLSVNAEYLAHKYDDFKAVKMIKEAGFDAVDYSFFYMKYDENHFNKDDYVQKAQNLRRYADELGIVFNQTHAPFPAYRFGDDELNEKMIPRIKRSIEIASILGAPHIVVHPIISFPGNADKRKMNMEFLRGLIPTAKRFNMKIALENTFGYDPKRDVIIPAICSFANELHSYIDELGDDVFIICVDTGHACVVGTEPEILIKEAGEKRLKALHIHDNDYRGDYHRLPYRGKIDWDKVARALADINYSGDFTLETDETPLSGFDEELYPTVLRFMHDVGRFLIGKIEAYNHKK